MGKIIKLSEVPSGKRVLDFNTLAVMTALRSNELRAIATAKERYVVVNDNNVHYALPNSLAGILYQMKLGMREQFGDQGADIMLARGVGMLWTKGAPNDSTKSAWISVGCDGNDYERRIDYREISFH